jgi:hypothetical protein
MDAADFEIIQLLGVARRTNFTTEHHLDTQSSDSVVLR